MNRKVCLSHEVSIKMLHQTYKNLTQKQQLDFMEQIIIHDNTSIILKNEKGYEIKDVLNAYIKKIELF